MNDKRMQPLLDAWFRDRDETARDASGDIARVMADVPRIRQRGRWWPFPLFRREAQTATTIDTTDYRPSPIPATNGRAPTVIGRTQTMFSPVKAITAGALVFAIGGVLLIAQPFDQQGGVPGAEQGADYPDPEFVTSTFIRLDCEEATGHTDGSTEADGPVNRAYGSTCTVYREWSDPRLQGPESWFLNFVEYDDESFFIGHEVRVIVTDEGAWRMRPVFLFESEDGPGNEVGTLVFDGEDAYEGLSVVLDDNDRGDPLSGYIISTDLVPPAPEEGSTK